MSLQAQIAELAASGGGAIALPHGDVSLPSAGLLLDPRVSLTGAGPSTRLLYDGPGSALYRTGSLTHSMMRLADFQVVCSDAARYGLDLRGAANLGQVTCERVLVRGGAAAGVVASSLYGSAFRQCASLGSRDGIVLGKACIGVKLEQCWVRDFLRFGVMVAGESSGPAQLVRVSDCIVDQPRANDGQQGDYWASGLYTGFSHSVLVEGSHFEGLRRGVFLGGSPSRCNSVVGCSFRQGAAGAMTAIEVYHASRNALVRANQIEGCSVPIVDGGQSTTLELQPEAR